MNSRACKTDEVEQLTPNQGVVMEFIEAMNKKDIDRIMTYFAEETVYHNIPMDPVHDHKSIRAIIGFWERLL